jgi:hypothetical protein
VLIPLKLPKLSQRKRLLYPKSQQLQIEKTTHNSIMATSYGQKVSSTSSTPILRSIWFHDDLIRYTTNSKKPSLTYHCQVTTGPESKNAINEAVGTVTSDSLAGESLKNSGSFGEGNPKAAASKQPSSSTTTNTHDTSNATKLDAAVNSEARDAQDGWNEEKLMNSAKGLGKESGVGPTYAGVGGSSDGASSGGAAGTAPTGVAGNNVDPNVLQPKGANLTEDPNMRGNTKFGEIGTEDDPARQAELRFQKTDAANAAVDTKIDMAQGGDSKFSGLGDTDA